MKERIALDSLRSRVVSPETAARFIDDGMTVAMSGYAMAGYPKAVVKALAERKREDGDFSINLLTGANVPWIDEVLASENIISRRAPMVASRKLSSQVNSGSVRYAEQQMNKMPRLIRRGSFGKIDVAIVEALAIDEKGLLIPSSSVGMVHHLMDAAEEIIVEINSAQPMELADLHDIYIPAPPPSAKPIPLVNANQRIGGKGIPVSPEKIRCIVESAVPERLVSQVKSTGESVKIAENLFDFLKEEYEEWGGLLPPIQTGFGSIANAVADAFSKSDFRDLQFFCGGIAEPLLELLAQGKAEVLSTGGLAMSGRVVDILKTTPDLKDKLIIRNGDITNNGEVISRLGLIALNTGIEIDIYGNVNSSHIAGSRVVNGIGGGANFAQNSGLSILLIPSAAKGGAISSIVPMVSHQDIGEHDVDVVITEQGIADLRGLDDEERADAIIGNCASPLYKDQLSGYLDNARKSCGGHHPQDPEKAFAWYARLKEKKTMLEQKDE